MITTYHGPLTDNPRHFWYFVGGLYERVENSSLLFDSGERVLSATGDGDGNILFEISEGEGFDPDLPVVQERTPWGDMRDWRGCWYFKSIPTGIYYHGAWSNKYTEGMPVRDAIEEIQLLVRRHGLRDARVTVLPVRSDGRQTVVTGWTKGSYSEIHRRDMAAERERKILEERKESARRLRYDQYLKLKAEFEPTQGEQ